MDTATPAVTVALHDGEAVVASTSQVDARRHGELLLPAVDRVLKEAGRTLDAVTGIVVGVGPGPYTGLRVGLVTAAAFSSALGVPVHGLCTLDGLAYASGIDEPFAVATDARRKEVYWARYEDSRTRVTDAAVTGAVLMRSWDRSAGLKVAELDRARAADQWKAEERLAELESDLEEARALRSRLDAKLRAKRVELAGLRGEHADLLRRYATAETERASALEGARLLALESAAGTTSGAVKELTAGGSAPVRSISVTPSTRPGVSAEWSQASRRWQFSRAPSATTCTRPSSRFRAKPTRPPISKAFALVNQRNPTPCTRPRTQAVIRTSSLMPAR